MARKKKVSFPNFGMVYAATWEDPEIMACLKTKANGNSKAARMAVKVREYFSKYFC